LDPQRVSFFEEEGVFGFTKKITPISVFSVQDNWRPMALMPPSSDQVSGKKS
jgi:hypothetical protein